MPQSNVQSGFPREESHECHASGDNVNQSWCLPIYFSATACARVYVNKHWCWSGRMTLLRAGQHAVALKRGPLYAAFVAGLCLIGFWVVRPSIHSIRPSRASCDPETLNAEALGQALQNIASVSQTTKQSSLGASAVGTAALQDRGGLAGAHLSSVPRAVLPTMDNRMQVSVPLTIWQSLPLRNESFSAMSPLFNSWTVQHPEWDHFLVDDEEMRSYIQEHLEPAMAELFWTMPSAEMRADAFRCARAVTCRRVYAFLQTCQSRRPCWSGFAHVPEDHSAHAVHAGCTNLVLSDRSSGVFERRDFGAGHVLLGAVITGVPLHIIMRESMQFPRSCLTLHCCETPCVFSAGSSQQRSSNRRAAGLGQQKERRLQGAAARMHPHAPPASNTQPL